MSYLIDKFKGKYRLKVPYDLQTNSFPKKLNGNFEDADCYIDCQYGNQVFHYGGNILQAYIPSLIRGHKIINSIDPEFIFDIEETDGEVLFQFKYSQADKIIPLLKPKTNGANISPFSSKNLPRNKDYKIPDEELQSYKDLVANTPKNKRLGIGIITNNFIKTLATKKNPMENIKEDMKLKGLKGKEYIHAIGRWKDFVKFLETTLREDL